MVCIVQMNLRPITAPKDAAKWTDMKRYSAQDMHKQTAARHPQYVFCKQKERMETYVQGIQYAQSNAKATK